MKATLLLVAAAIPVAASMTIHVVDSRVGTSSAYRGETVHRFMAECLEAGHGAEVCECTLDGISSDVEEAELMSMSPAERARRVGEQRDSCARWAEILGLADAR